GLAAQPLSSSPGSQMPGHDRSTERRECCWRRVGLDRSRHRTRSFYHVPMFSFKVHGVHLKCTARWIADGVRINFAELGAGLHADLITVRLKPDTTSVCCRAASYSILRLV